MPFQIISNFSLCCGLFDGGKYSVPFTAAIMGCTGGLQGSFAIKAAVLKYVDTGTFALLI
jgi:uncharacterized membrane protein